MTLYTEKYRPQYHFSPKEKWMNDPNGMVYYNGEYHLFYQCHPNGTTWGPMHWGHAISKDLIHWEHMPIALKPDKNGTIFSGSAVVDWHDTTGFFDGGSGLVAIFTHHLECPETKHVSQTQSLAYSKDNGRTWEKYQGNPVLANSNYRNFRDPKVFWYNKTNRWIMTLACGQSIQFYESTNLRNWEFLSEFGEGNGSHCGVWECPDLFQLPIVGTSESKWVLIVSIGDRLENEEGSRAQYFIGKFDGKKFTNDNTKETILWLDHGRDNYAGVTWSDLPSEDGRRIYIAWMNNWRYANEVPTDVWRGSMTLPRDLKLISTKTGIRVSQQVVKEIEQLRGNRHVWKDLRIEPKNNFRKNLDTDQLEISLTFEIGNENSLCLGLNEENGTPCAVIEFSDEELSVIRLGDSYFAKGKVTMNSITSLKIFVDCSSIEVFVNEGEESLTYLLFPHNKIKELVLGSRNVEAVIHSLDVYELNGIWK